MEKGRTNSINITERTGRTISMPRHGVALVEKVIEKVEKKGFGVLGGCGVRIIS